MDKNDKLYESIHNIISNWTEQTVDEGGEATYTFNDDDREAMITEFYKLLKSE